jgi:hypothetical protein
LFAIYHLSYIKNADMHLKAPEWRLNTLLPNIWYRKWAMGWTTAQLWFNSQHGHEFSPLQNTQAGTVLSVLRDPHKWPGEEADYSWSPCSKVKDAWHLKHAQEQFHLYLSQANSI